MKYLRQSWKKKYLLIKLNVKGQLLFYSLNIYFFNTCFSNESSVHHLLFICSQSFCQRSIQDHVTCGTRYSIPLSSHAAVRHIVQLQIWCHWQGNYSRKKRQAFQLSHMNNQLFYKQFILLQETQRKIAISRRGSAVCVTQLWRAG